MSQNRRVKRPTTVELDSRIQRLEQHLAELQRRSGHKPLGAKIGGLTRDVAQLRQQLAEQGPSEALAERMSRIERNLGSRVAMLEEGQSSLSQRMDQFDEFGRRLTEVEGQANITAASTAKAHDRLDVHDARLTRLEQIRVRAENFPWVGFVVAIVAGIVAGVLWHGHDFSVMAANVTTEITVPVVADELWVAWVFGLAIFSIVLGLWLLMKGLFLRPATVSQYSSSNSLAVLPAKTAEMSVVKA